MQTDRVGLAMLVVAPLVSAVRAALAVLGIDEPWWYWIGFVLGGSLSGLGMLVLAVAWWGRDAFWFLAAGAVTAFVGHNIVPATAAQLSGPALVQLGTGLVLAPVRPWAPVAGVLAASGAVLRHLQPLEGNLLLLVGTAGFVAAIVGAVSPDMHTRR